MTYEELKAETQRYNATLEEFIWNNLLPQTWFEDGVDHVAVKAYNADDYDSLIKDFRPLSEQITEVQMNNRRIAAAKLLGKYSLDFMQGFDQGPMSWLEIMEARPEDQCDDPVRLDHEEVYAKFGIRPMFKVLSRKGFNPDLQENYSHEWVSVIISEVSDELKFTDRRLEAIVEADLEIGRATYL